VSQVAHKKAIATTTALVWTLIAATAMMVFSRLIVPNMCVQTIAAQKGLALKRRCLTANVSLNGEGWTVPFGRVRVSPIARTTVNACQMPRVNAAMVGLELLAIFLTVVVVLHYSVLDRAFAITW